jgi:hypothetical protein
MEEFFEIADPARLEPATLATSGFDSGFDWTTLLDTDIVLGKFIDGRLAGLIAFRHVPENLGNFVDLLEVAKPFRHQQVAKKLLAMVMLDSFETPDFDGFVQLRPKQNGIQYFYLNLGGFAHDRSIIFDTDTSRIHVQRYLPSGGKIL